MPSAIRYSLTVKQNPLTIKKSIYSRCPIQPIMAKTKEKRKRLNPLLVNFIVVFCSSIACFIIGFLSLEFYYIKTTHRDTDWVFGSQFDPDLGWNLAPNQKPSWSAPATNSLGFRSPEINPKKNQIAVVGDSVAFGWFVSDREHMPFYLDRFVEPFGYQALNLGVAGHALDQYYLHLQKYLSHFNRLKHVIVVVMASDDNDLPHSGSNEVYGKRKPLFRIDGEKLKLQDPKIKKYCFRNLIGCSQFLALFIDNHPKVRAFCAPYIGDRQLSQQETEKVALMIFDGLQALAASKGAGLTVVLSPGTGDIPKKNRVYLWFKKQLEKKGIDTIDYQSMLTSLGADRGKKLFLDGCHYNKAGNQHLARILYQHLLKKKVIRPHA
jgi:hypothetical protein